MANVSLASALQACPPPFLIGADYPYVAGEEAGRLCAPSLLNTQVQCCLPCPLTNSIYPDDFDAVSLGAQWLAVPALVCTIVLLISFAVLPVQRTSRHYLTICLIIAIFVLELAYVVPLGTKPDQCSDAITPHNMRSDMSCAFSGAFLLFGGFGGVMWVFLRSLSLHLQICWQYVPGKPFFYAAQLAGWGLTVLFTILALVLSGVSYRLGSTCYINHANSIGAYWGPLLALAGSSLFMQLITFIYCLKVYLQVAHGPKGLPSSNGTGTQATTSSTRSVIARRATYRRVRKVIALQWRGMTVVVLVVITACYLATVFLLLDQDISHAYQDVQSIIPWVACLVINAGDKKGCASLTSAFVLSEQVVLPVPYLIVACGIWCLFFLGRWAMILGWRDLLMRLFQRDRHGSSSPRSQSQLSFRDRLQGTPQHLHIIKGETGGLSVARKSETMDIEMVSPISPAHSEKSHYDHDRDHAGYHSTKSVQLEEALTRPAPAMGPAPMPRPFAPRSSSSTGHVSFNFSRPNIARNNHSADPQPSLRSAPNSHKHSQSQSQSQTQTSYSQARLQRSASNASESWLISDPEPMSYTMPLASSRSPAPHHHHGSHGTSQTESHAPELKPSHGTAWDPTSTFASSRQASHSASDSPLSGNHYYAHGYSTAGSSYGVR